MDFNVCSYILLLFGKNFSCAFILLVAAVMLLLKLEKELEGWGILYRSCKRFHVCWFCMVLELTTLCTYPVLRPTFFLLLFIRSFKVITQPSTTFVGPVPADGTPIKMISVIPLPIVVIYYIIATMGIVFTLACLIFTTVYRKKK